MKTDALYNFKNDLLKYHIKLENYREFVDYFTLLEKNMTKEMNEQFSVILEFLLDLLENNILELKSFDDPKFNSSQYWLNNLYNKKQYFNNIYDEIQQRQEYTQSDFYNILETIIDLLKNKSSEYHFSYDIRCIQVPLRDRVKINNDEVVKNYLFNNLSLVDNTIVALNKLESLIKE